MTTPPSTSTKTNPALSVYLGQELADQVAQAKADGKFDPKDLCKQVLQDAVEGKLPGAGVTDSGAELQQAQAQVADYLGILTRSQEAWNLVAARLNVDLALPADEFTTTVLSRIDEMRVAAAMGERAQHPAQVLDGAALPGSRADYVVHWLSTEEELLAQIDNLISQGGSVVSSAPAVDGRFFLLAAWPIQIS